MAGDGYYKIDFLLPTNQDWNDTFRIGTGEGEDFEPTDLTGCTFQMHIRRAVEDTSAVMILNAANSRLGISLVDPDGDTVTAADGYVAIYVPDEHVQRIAPGGYVHDILMFDSDGNPKRIAVGTVTVEKGVTRV
jgi:hypothetical protein